MLWQLALILFLVWCLKQQWDRRHLTKLKKQFRKDWIELPLIGCTHYFLGGTETQMNALKNISKQSIKYGGWTAAQVGVNQFTIVTDPVEAEYVMKTHLEKDDIYKTGINLIGNGLVFAPVSIWRPRRKVMAPTFSQHNLNQFVDIFYQQSALMVDKLSEVADGRKFSIWKNHTSYALDSVCQTTMGVNVGAQKTSGHPFLTAFRKYADIFSKRVFYPWLSHDLVFKYLGFGLYDENEECIEILHNFTKQIIRNKRVELAAIKENGASVEHSKKGSSEPGRFRPILELLIEASGTGQQGYTDEELMEETLVLLLAGTDTSAVGSAFTTMMLAQNPDKQEKVFQEIYNLYGDSDRPLRVEDLNKLPYLEAFIKESLRMYPPVPMTARKVFKTDVTPAGIRLEPGLRIVVSHWGIMRNPKYWGDDADEFRPERFFDSPPKHPSAFIPFAAGPRNCLGYKYAMMSIMTATTCILRRYRILPSGEDEPGKPLRITFEIMMKHANDFQIRLEPRKYK